MRNASRFVACLAVALLAPLSAAHTAAQHAASLRLEDAVATALARNAGIQLSQQRLELARGELLMTRGAYDVRLRAALGGGQDAQQAPGENGALSSLVTHTTSYQAGASKRFRSGIVLTPQFSVTRSGIADGPAPPTSTAGADARLLIPLQGDGRALASAAERAATASYAAEQFSLVQATATGVLEVVEAYWSFVAARRRQQVYLESERRAQQLVSDTRELTRAEERPAADTNQVLANLANKRLARMAAEQAVTEARRRLGLAMGLDVHAMRGLAAPQTPLPETRPFAADDATLDRLYALALDHRTDLRASAQRVNAAHVRHAAARARLRPRVDLSLMVGYQGHASGAGFGQFFEPLYRQIPGLNTSIQITYELPVTNTEAAGSALQQASALEQEQIAAAHLTNRVLSGVHVAAEALERSVAATVEASAALSLYAQTVAAEKEKHRFAAATLIDVILTEDGLTGAMVSQVDAQLSYALAIARLRLETGTLVENGRDASGVVVRLESLLISP